MNIYQTTLGQSAEGIEVLERIMDMNKQSYFYSTN